jgi:hypothetical protein
MSGNARWVISRRKPEWMLLQEFFESILVVDFADNEYTAANQWRPS